jgi:hypothetical protein
MPRSISSWLRTVSFHAVKQGVQQRLPVQPGQRGVRDSLDVAESLG